MEADCVDVHIPGNVERVDGGEGGTGFGSEGTEPGGELTESRGRRGPGPGACAGGERGFGEAGGGKAQVFSHHRTAKTRSRAEGTGALFWAQWCFGCGRPGPDTVGRQGA